MGVKVQLIKRCTFRHFCKKYPKYASSFTQCTICQVSFQPNTAVQQMSCEAHHIFHRPCLIKWFKEQEQKRQHHHDGLVASLPSFSCPNCRQSLSNDHVLIPSTDPFSIENRRRNHLLNRVHSAVMYVVDDDERNYSGWLPSRMMRNFNSFQITMPWDFFQPWHSLLNGLVNLSL